MKAQRQKPPPIEDRIEEEPTYQGELAVQALNFSRMCSELIGRYQVRNSLTQINHRLAELAQLTFDTSIMNELKELLVENANACNLQGKCVHERATKLLDVLRLNERTGACLDNITNMSAIRQAGSYSHTKPSEPNAEIFSSEQKHQYLQRLPQQYLPITLNLVEAMDRTAIYAQLNVEVKQHTKIGKKEGNPLVSALQRYSTPIATKVDDRELSRSPIRLTNQIYTQTEYYRQKTCVTEQAQTESKVECYATTTISNEREKTQWSLQEQQRQRTLKQNDHRAVNECSDGHTTAKQQALQNNRKRHLNFASGTLINIHEVLRARKQSRSQDSDKVKKIDQFKKHIQSEMEQINSELRLIKNVNVAQPKGDDDQEIEELEEQIRKLNEIDKGPSRIKLDLSAKLKKPTGSRVRTISKSPGGVSSFLVSDQQDCTSSRVEIKFIKATAKRRTNEQMSYSPHNPFQKLQQDTLRYRQGANAAKETTGRATNQRKPLLSQRTTHISRRP